MGQKELETRRKYQGPRESGHEEFKNRIVRDLTNAGRLTGFGNTDF